MPIMAIGGIEGVRFVVQDQVVAEHLRDWDKENVHYDPVHYLALLERKPGALDFGKPFDDWDLPEGFGVLRRRLEGELGSTAAASSSRCFGSWNRANSGNWPGPWIARWRSAP